MEAPDECGHHGDVEHKIYSIEQIDKKVVGPIYNALKNSGEDFGILIMPDHPTPISKMTHVSDPVPYVLYRSDKKVIGSAESYTEKQAEATGVYEPFGFNMIKKLIEK